MKVLDSHKGICHSAELVTLSTDRGIPSGQTDCGIKVTSRFWPNVGTEVSCPQCKSHGA